MLAQERLPKWQMQQPCNQPIVHILLPQRQSHSGVMLCLWPRWLRKPQMPWRNHNTFITWHSSSAAGLLMGEPQVLSSQTDTASAISRHA